MPTPPIGDMACAASPMQEKPGPRPTFEAVDGDREKLHVVPRGDLVHPIGERRVQRDDGSPERLQPGRTHFLIAAFGDDIGALPIVAAVKHDKDHARLNPSKRLLLVLGASREAQPQHVHGCAEILDL